jgi:hypothetical protein
LPLSMPWRHIGTAEIWLHSFIMSLLMEVSSQLHALTALPLENILITHWIRSWVGLGTSLDSFGEEKI